MSIDSTATVRSFVVIAGVSRSIVNFRGPLIRSLIDEGIQVHAIAPSISENKLVVSKLNKWGVKYYDVPLKRAGLNPVDDLKAFFVLHRLIKQIQPDLVLAYTVKPVVYGMLASWLAKVPKRFALITGLGYAFTGESRGKRKLIKKLARLFYRTVLARVNLVFFQNPDDESYFRESGLLKNNVPSRIVNGSGIDLNHFSRTPLEQRDPVFLLIARLIGDKGVREFVAAARRIRKSYPSTVFRIVGSIDDNPDSIRKEELDQWQREGAIEYLGKLEDVRPAIAESSVYVLPSYREGTPRTVLEAMAMGRPVITTDAPGCRETVVNGYNGYLVGVKSEEDLFQAMRHFIIRPDLISLMGSRSYQIAVDKYDVNKVNREMLAGMGLLKP